MKSPKCLKQYNPAKPHKWDFNNFVLSGVSGYSYDFDIFAGAQSDTYPEGAPKLGVSGNVVSRLSANNYFSTTGSIVLILKSTL